MFLLATASAVVFDKDRGSFTIDKYGSIEISNSRFCLKIPRENFKKITLKNGMTVLAFKNTRSPKVLVQIAYDVGSTTEQPDEHGLAHLIEHMIFKGTEKRMSESDIVAIARKYGASYNAYTSKHTTSYFFEADKNNWKPFCGILADCMQNARFDAEHLNSEMKAVINELRGCEDNYWGWMVDKAVENVWPEGDPYQHDVLGGKKDLLLFSAQRLRDFYKKYYHPGKATLFIVGDIDVDNALSLARSNFEQIINGCENKQAGELPAKHVGSLVVPSNKTDVAYRDIQNEQLGFYWKVPGFKGSDNSSLASVVSQVLCGGQGSRLYRRLVDEEKTALFVGTNYFRDKETGVFFILVAPKKDCTQKCRQIIQEELRKIVNSGISADELTKILRGKELGVVSSYQHSGSLVAAWIDSFLTGDDEYEIFKTLDDYARIDQPVVQSFVREHLDPEIINELRVLPLAEMPVEQKEAWEKEKKSSAELFAKIEAKFQRQTPFEEPKLALTMPDPEKIDHVFPKPDEILELDNGLQVVLCRDGFVPLVTTSIGFREAAFLSSTREETLSSWMMGMLNEGSVGLSKKDIVDFFELRGVGNWFSSGGSGFTMVNTDYKTIFERFFHVLTKPDFQQEALDKLKSASLEGMRRMKDSPGAMASYFFQKMIYKNHKFGWDYDEELKFTENLGLEDLRIFHQKLVSPKNMIITICGDIDIEKTKRDIKEALGDWQGPEYRTVTKKEKSDFVPGDQKDHFMDREQVMMLLGRSSDIDRRHPDFIPLRMTNFIAFEGFGSRLYELREQEGLFYGASGGFGVGGSTRVPGYDYVSVAVAPANLKVVESKVNQFIATVGQDGVCKKELDDASKNILNGLIDSYSSTQATAATLSYLAELDLGFDYYDSVLKRVQNITVEELNQVCTKYYKSDGFSRVRVGRV